MTFLKLLVNTTPRADNDAAITAAIALSQRFGSSVKLLDVTPDLSWPLQYLTGGWEQTIESIAGTKQKRLQVRAEQLTALGIKTDYALSDGRLSAAIVEEVQSGNHDLVVKVAEAAAGNRSGFLGSTDFRLLRTCPCAVLIVKHDDDLGFQRVAAALDVMDDHQIQRGLDERVLQTAAELCQGTLQLVYAMPRIREVVHVDSEDADLVSTQQLAAWEDQLAASAQEKLDAARHTLTHNRCECHLLREASEAAIPEFVNAQAIDLLVMGTVARSGLEGLLMGNTAERILGNVDCSVLALKPPQLAPKASYA